MKAGAVDFIEKPIDEEQLLTAIDAALEDKKLGTRHQTAARAAELMARLSPPRMVDSGGNRGRAPKQADRLRSRHQRRTWNSTALT